MKRFLLVIVSGMLLVMILVMFIFEFLNVSVKGSVNMVDVMVSMFSKLT